MGFFTGNDGKIGGVVVYMNMGHGQAVPERRTIKYIDTAHSRFQPLGNRRRKEGLTMDLVRFVKCGCQCSVGGG